jgi:hypothetical protein
MLIENVCTLLTNHEATCVNISTRHGLKSDFVPRCKNFVAVAGITPALLTK